MKRSDMLFTWAMMMIVVGVAEMIAARFAEDSTWHRSGAVVAAIGALLAIVLIVATETPNPPKS
jgi:uncharacterized membrane protein HdeD (DUF308 family)